MLPPLEILLTFWKQFIFPVLNTYGGKSAISRYLTGYWNIVMTTKRRPDTWIDLGKVGLQNNDDIEKTSKIDYQSMPADYSSAKRLKKKREPIPSPFSDSRPDLEHIEETDIDRSLILESPWNSYEKLYSLQFGENDYVTVAEKTRPEPDQSPLVIVKEFVPGSGAINAIQKVHHKQFVSLQKLYSTGSTVCAFFEFMPLSLSEIAGHPLMNDLRLASILGQVRDLNRTESSINTY